MNKNLIKNAMKYMIKIGEKENKENSWNDFKKYIVENSNDRRYKPCLLASRTSLDSMLVKYMNKKYNVYFDYSIQDVIVEIDK